MSRGGGDDGSPFVQNIVKMVRLVQVQHGECHLVYFNLVYLCKNEHEPLWCCGFNVLKEMILFRLYQFIILPLLCSLHFFFRKLFQKELSKCFALCFHSFPSQTFFSADKESIQLYNNNNELKLQLYFKPGLGGLFLARRQVCHLHFDSHM